MAGGGPGARPPRQSALIVREGEILTAVQEMIAAFQATIAQRHG